MLRIGLIQMSSEKGEVDENLAQISKYIAEAKVREIDIVGFPEMSITGYADPNRYPQAVIWLDGDEVSRFLALTEGSTATVLAGLIEANPGGEKPYITQIVAENGRLSGYYRKVTIKDEEVEWFTPGDQIPVFKREDLTYGISICADIDNEMVFARCAQQGAQIVFELAAPGLYGDQATRNWQTGFDWWRGECREKLGNYARKYHLWIAVATQAGRTVDEDFPGGAYLFSPDGECQFATPDWSPAAVFLEIDFEHGLVHSL